MRVNQKYKKFSKHYSPLSCVPKNKILKFHRSKWIKVQKTILKNKQKKKINKIKFKYFWKAFCQKTRWGKASHIYRTQLSLKKTIQTLFLNSVSNAYLKKKVFKTNIKFFYFQFLFYKLEYRLDILLLRLNFFKNSFLVKQNLQQKQIFVNNQENFFFLDLAKGDVISIHTFSNIVFNSTLEDFRIFTPFIEIDYYSNQIVIVKDLRELTHKDFLLLSRDFYSILDLRDYFSN